MKMQPLSAEVYQWSFRPLWIGGRFWIWYYEWSLLPIISTDTKIHLIL